MLGNVFDVLVTLRASIAHRILRRRDCKLDIRSKPRHQTVGNTLTVAGTICKEPDRSGVNVGK